MSLEGLHQIKEATGICKCETAAIKHFLQGAIYCWCKNINQNEWFSLSELMGGKNFYWEGTPLMCLYTKHEKKGSENPVNQAGIDAGWLLKAVVNNDSRKFETKKEYQKDVSMVW